MRHRKKFNHLSRKSAHRKAMLSNMATSLIMHKRIHTTLAKAKALRMYVEPLINRSKDDTTHSRRVVFSYLQSKEAVTELFRVVSVKVADRPGGYTRIIKLDNRLGDNAEMCMMELVDFNENLLSDKGTKTAKTTRRRRGSKKKATDAAEGSDVATKTETKLEEKVEAKVETKVEDKVEEAKEVKEEVKAEAKEEPKKEEKKEEPKPEAKKEEAPKAKKEEDKAEKPDTEEKK
ncbi:MAG: 50S ribosomal protein L17 [Chlorobi bacterium]|nr:50S ribosomal protein L17 [Chlorobiota bacterium]